MGVFRVWQFLDSWGIINYQAGAGAADDTDGLPLTVQPAGDQTTNMVMPASCMAASVSEGQWACLTSGYPAFAAEYCCSELSCKTAWHDCHKCFAPCGNQKLHGLSTAKASTCLISFLGLNGPGSSDEGSGCCLVSQKSMPCCLMCLGK